MRRSACCVAAFVLGLALAAPAAASPETLRRAMSNVLFGPLDMVLSPITGPQSVYQGLRDQDDSAGVIIVWTVPGVLWNTSVQAGAGSLRILAGLIEVLPGIGLFFFDADLDPIFAPVDRADAWIDEETTLLHVKFPINYANPASF